MLMLQKWVDKCSKIPHIDEYLFAISVAFKFQDSNANENHVYSSRDKL